MEEILGKVRHIEWKTRKFVDSLLAGEYRTKFRGQGMQFAEFREYQAGDDVRHISWSVSAKKIDPVVKLFEEERELHVLLVVDRSSSLSYGSGKYSKQEVVAEVACALSFAAIRNQDRIGLLGFGEDIEYLVRPEKGRKHVLRIIKHLLEDLPPKQTTNFNEALKRVDRLLPHRGIIVLISDFLCDFDEKLIHRLAKRHQLLILDLEDPIDYEPPAVGFVELYDPETGEKFLEFFNKSRVAEWKAKRLIQREKINSLSKKYKCDLLSLNTEGNHLDELVRFLAK